MSAWASQGAVGGQASRFSGVRLVVSYGWCWLVLLGIGWSIYVSLSELIQSFIFVGAWCWPAMLVPRFASCIWWCLMFEIKFHHCSPLLWKESRSKQRECNQWVPTGWLWSVGFNGQLFQIQLLHLISMFYIRLVSTLSRVIICSCQRTNHLWNELVAGEEQELIDVTIIFLIRPAYSFVIQPELLTKKSWLTIPKPHPPATLFYNAFRLSRAWKPNQSSPTKPVACVWWCASMTHHQPLLL